MVPVHHARDLVARIPHAELHLLPGDGHISIQRRAGDILDALPRRGVTSPAPRRRR